LSSWLVTGASGFLGRHLLAAIEAEPDRPDSLALVRSEAAWRAMEWTGSLRRVRTLRGSVTEPLAWADRPELAGLSGIFHLAALVRHGGRDASEVIHTNVEGTLNMVRLAAARRCRMLFVSTSGTVGCFRRAGESADEDAPYCEREVSRWPYYRSKLEAERQARRLAGELKVDLVILRPPVLLGPGDHRLRSSAHVLRVLRGGLPFLIRGGMHFADVRDVAQALVRAMERPTARPIYHLPGTAGSLADFYRQTAELSGTRAPRLILPFRPAWLLALAAQRMGLSILPDPSLVEMAAHYWGISSRYAAEELGYHSRPGRETLAETIAWLRTNHPELAKP
jgi:dihydroflavonol-4-reductase